MAKHPSKLDLGDYLPYLANRVGTIIAEQFGADALARHGLSIADVARLAVLASNGGQRQIDLADLTSIDASTLSRLVTRLVRMGHATRTRSANSNREVAVKLSAKGQALVAASFRSRATTKPWPSPACRRRSCGAQALPAAGL